MCPVCPVVSHFFVLGLLRIVFADGEATRLLDLNLSSQSVN